MLARIQGEVERHKPLFVPIPWHDMAGMGHDDHRRCHTVTDRSIWRGIRPPLFAARLPKRWREAVVRFAPIALLLAASLAASPAGQARASAENGSWTSYHRSASNNAAFTEPGQAAMSWRSVTMKDEILAVSVVSDTVYAAGAGQTHAVYALSRRSGQPIWGRLVDNVVMTQPIVAGGRVFVGTGNNYMRDDPVRDYNSVSRGTDANSIYALDQGTGTVLWKLALQGEAMPTPIYSAGTLYWATGDRRFLAVDAASGRIVWSLRLPSYVSMSSPVRDGNLIMFGGAHPFAEYAVDIVSRRIAWRHAFTQFGGRAVTGAIDDCSPAVSDHTLFCTGTTSATAMPNGGDTVGQFAWALDTRTGQALWQSGLGDGKLPDFFAAGVPTVLNGVVYVESPGNKGLWALAARTGHARWHATLAAMGRSAPVVDGAALFTTDDAGTLYQFDARTGSLAHRMRLGGGVSNLGIVLASGSLYVPNSRGGVVDAIPERLITAAPGIDVAPPNGPVATTQNGVSCG